MPVRSRLFFNFVLQQACGAFLIAAICLWSAPFGSAQDPAPSTTRSLVILHINDFHARLLPEATGADAKVKGGAANISAFIHQTRGHRTDVLVFDAGDMTQGTPVSTIFKGKPIFEVWNTMGIDFATFGNHEFDYGVDMTREYLAIARFPFLSANGDVDGKLLGDGATTIALINGIKVGLIALTTAQSVRQPHLTILDAEQALRKYLPELKSRADIIILLSHLGIERDEELAHKLPEINVIVGGHSHTPIQQPRRVEHTLIVQAGAYGQYVGELSLVVDLASKSIAQSEGRLVPIPVPNLPQNPGTLGAVEKWESKVSDTVDVKIGYNPKRQPETELKRNMEFILKRIYGSDFAIQNSAGTRADLPEGDIRVRNIYNIMPFDNNITILRLTRAQAAEEIAGAQFQEDKPFYTVAMNSYIANRLIEKYKIPSERIEQKDQMLRDVLIDYIKKTGRFGPAAATPAPALQPAGAGK
ncbi:MAG: bifunctional UDP-sugar hydrolase/5'-nucleotidase [Candidatus Sumerlaeota bacterium]|nr:bifunctional UDP-sugar hydrolase/5'-nucleotidase [Candidatus Sumerlaeota bacterium]